ncbi:uncharacterized protein LOC110765036 [Prunus avium]|uniref:Uncharacterized protein LOC110765036 n=1 Tax=Prunus avium TaxID=42229 RepID=A0A6P5T9G3_PRUAV|nr:uncharacterized protein LOC110765036 [Prunus avium]
MEEVLERQEREIRERRHRRAASKRAQRDLDQQLFMAVALLDEENQSSRGSHEGRAANVDRHRHSRAAIRMLAYGASVDQVDEIARMGKSTALESLGDYGNRKGQKSIILEAVAGFDTWVWHAFFGVAGSQNDLNVLGQSPVFNDVLRGEAPKVTYEINNTVYQTGYYLADGIYPRWTTFVKSIPHPRTQKQKLFATHQESYRKDVERCFGILQARWAIIRGAARMFDEEVLRSIMMTCIILHNMIVEDEYDYEAEEVYEEDPMNTALTRIYEKPIGPNGEPLEHEPLVRDGRFMHRMIDRYTEMQSSYIHERRQVDLMEHL